MKKLLLLFIGILFTGLTYSQNGGVAPLAKGEHQLNFGTGFTSSGFPIYASYDFAVHKDVTVTPQVSVKFNNDEVRFGAVVKGDYHWNYLIGIPSNWDFYAGASVGFDFGDDFYPNINIHVGGRWYWTEKWGLNVEFGGGNVSGTIVGLSMKL